MSISTTIRFPRRPRQAASVWCWRLRTWPGTCPIRTPCGRRTGCVVAPSTLFHLLVRFRGLPLFPPEHQETRTNRGIRRWSERCLKIGKSHCILLCREIFMLFRAISKQLFFVVVLFQCETFAPGKFVPSGKWRPFIFVCCLFCRDLIFHADCRYFLDDSYKLVEFCYPYFCLVTMVDLNPDFPSVPGLRVLLLVVLLQ